MRPQGRFLAYEDDTPIPPLGEYARGNGRDPPPGHGWLVRDLAATSAGPSRDSRATLPASAASPAAAASQFPQTSRSPDFAPASCPHASVATPSCAPIAAEPGAHATGSRRSRPASASLASGAALLLTWIGPHL